MCEIAGIKFGKREFNQNNPHLISFIRETEQQYNVFRYLSVDENADQCSRT
jgi:hypothetical protein